MTIKTVKMYRKINYSDHLEKQIGETLQDCKIEKLTKNDKRI